MLDPNKLLFSSGGALESTDGVNTSTLAGSALSDGFVDGFSIEASFGHIIGFVQFNETTIFAVDKRNACIWMIDRASLQISQFVGQCGTRGYADGMEALFDLPTSIVKHIRLPNLLLVSDKLGIGSVRQVNVVTRATSTIIPQSVGLKEPTALAFDLHAPSDELVISNQHYIGRYNFDTKQFTLVAGASSSGYFNGYIDSARFYHPRDARTLSPYVYLIADAKNNRLRIIDTVSGTVSSIGFGSQATTDGTPYTFNMPYGLLVHNGNIYVGEMMAIRIIPCE